ncbi:MAG: DUF4339 domain-containing protein [Maricaulaceae bacterium]|nr:DUF4339 domain-containing protein [Maricaulaceae bacterium]
MPRDDASASSWHVKVDGRVYGPYTPAQMRAYIGEGRVAAHSLVSPHREHGWAPAGDCEALQAWLEEARRGPGARPEPQGPAANFVIFVDSAGGDLSAFERALSYFGDAERVFAGVWLLRGVASASELRNELSHLLDRDDRLMVIDASRDQSAWFNLGGEADATLRALWGKAL